MDLRINNVDELLLEASYLEDPLRGSLLMPAAAKHPAQ
jgi:hypothetical protein